MNNPNAIDHDLQPLLDLQIDYQRRRIFEMQRERHRLEYARESRDRFSIARTISALATDGRLHGADRDFVERTADEAGKPFDNSRICIPIAELARDLHIATGTSGGYLKASNPTSEALDSLRPWSVVMQGGVQTMSGRKGDLSLSRTSTNTTVAWMSSETAAATASQPVISQNIVLSPKIAIGTINVSRQLRLQSGADAYVANELLRTAGTLLDQAVINGSGSSGQPTGILNIANVGTQSGTSLAWAGVLSMKRLASVANAADPSITFLSTPAIRATLEGRERAAGSGFIWQDNAIAGCRAYATTDMPSATMLCGPLDQVMVGLWSNGIEIQVSPYEATQFKQGTVTVRVLMAVDVGLLCDPAAFTKSSSIT